MAEHSWASSGRGVAESVGVARTSPGGKERRVVCFCLLGATQGCLRFVSSGPDAEQPVGFPTTSTLTCPAPWASGVCTDSISSKLVLLASVGMFEPLLCLGAETSSWQKRRGSWLGELALGRRCCPCRWEVGLEEEAYGARRIEDSIPWGVKGI